MRRKIFVFFLSLLPKPLGHKLLFRKYMHRKLDLNNPITLNEKIQWLILNKYGEKEALYADKFLVKSEIEKKHIDGLYIPKTLFVLGLNDELDLDALPDKFVLKCNHGSGHVFVCNDKNNFDLDGNIKILKKDLKKDFSKFCLEYHYSYINPVIIVEEYLDDQSHKLPFDYKFYCYDGYVDSVYVCADRDTVNSRDFFNKNWDHLDLLKKEKNSKHHIEKPENLDKMFEIASQLSKGFPFVRVDLYNINGKIYFSELTFTPAAGLNNYYTYDGDKYLGQFIDIDSLK